MIIILKINMSNKRPIEEERSESYDFAKRQKIMPASRYPDHSGEDIWARMIFTKEHVKGMTSRSRGNVNNFKPHVSGTDVRNYLQKDPLVDWLEHYFSMGLLQLDEPMHAPSQTKSRKTRISSNIMTRSKKRKQIDVNKEASYLSVLFEHGNEFEDKVVEYLYNYHRPYITTINTTNRYGSTRYNFKKTIRAMMDGIPIINQAVLFNDKNNTMGTADLLVRSDYINKLVGQQVLNEQEQTYKASKLTGNYHYRVIDIKWTTMILCADGKNIRNEGRFPSYKGQLAIYNCAMGEVQGYTPRQAYIMAKAWKIDKKGEEQEGYNCFDLLGVIDYNKFDYQFIEKTADAINWIQDVRKYGADWDPKNSC